MRADARGRLGRRAADDQRRDGTCTTRLQRPTLLVVDDADLRTSLISGLVDYLKWDNAGPQVTLLLLARAAGAWWDRLVNQLELADSYTVLDLDQHPVPLAGRAEHFRCASTVFAPYGGPGTQPVDASPPAELDDPAYAEPLLIHIAALLRIEGPSATPRPPGRGEERAPDKDITGRPAGPAGQASAAEGAVSARNRTAGIAWRGVAICPSTRTCASSTSGRAGHADRRGRTGVRHVLARGAAEPGRGHPARGRSAGRVGARALCRARLLESAAARPTRRAAAGRHRAAVHSRRRAARLAVGQRWENGASHPAARRADPRRPGTSSPSGRLRRAVRRSAAPRVSAWRFPPTTPSCPIWPASRSSWHLSPGLAARLADQVPA